MDQKTLEQLALSAYSAELEAKEAKAIADEAKQAFIEALQEMGKYDRNTKAIGIVKTDFSANNKFNLEKAFESLSKKEQKECLKTVPDPTLVKNHLNPIQLAKYMEAQPNPWKLSLKLDDSVVEDQ